MFCVYVLLISAFLYVEFSCFVYTVVHFKRRNSRGRAKMENKRGKKGREYKYFNSSVVMLVFFIYLKSLQPVTITVKKSTGGFRFD